MQRFETTVLFNCPECTEVNNIDIQVPEFSWAVEKMSELWSEDDVAFTCPSCNHEFYGYATCHSSGCDIELEEPPMTLEGDFPMYSPEPDEWLEYEQPKDPHSVFVSTYKQMSDLLAQDIETEDSQLISRMVFTQIISAMEAYLCDALIQNVIADKKRILKLCDRYDALKQKTYILPQLASQEKSLDDFIKNEVKESLKGIVYHDIDKVEKLYQYGLDLELIPQNEKKSELKKAIHYRHDCVHRNGMKKDDGEKNTVFTKKYVSETMALIKEIVDSIENTLSPF